MKLIPLRAENPFKSADVIKAVASQPTPGQSINVQDMRRRCRILDALDAACDGALLLEDADHTLLVELITAFPFAVAHSELLRIVDDVVYAKGSPQPLVAA